MQISSEIGFYNADCRCSPEKYFWKSGHPASNALNHRSNQCGESVHRIESRLFRTSEREIEKKRKKKKKKKKKKKRFYHRACGRQFTDSYEPGL